MRDPLIRAELKNARRCGSAWRCAVALVVLLIQPLLIIFGGIVFAAMLDGGARLLGRVLPIPRGLRLLIVVLLVIAFIAGTFWLAGVQIAAQFELLRDTLEVQADRFIGFCPGRAVARPLGSAASPSRRWARSGGSPGGGIGDRRGGQRADDRDPRPVPRDGAAVYERGLQWMVPSEERAEFAVTLGRMGGRCGRCSPGGCSAWRSKA